MRTYIEIHPRERLPEIGGYYAIVTDIILGHVHWSVEKQKWTSENGEVWDATYPNAWLEVLDQQPTSLQSLIERVEAEALSRKEGMPWIQSYNAGINTAIEVIKSTPCIRAKALRKKGTDKLHFLNHTEAWWTTPEYDGKRKDGELPPDAELIPIEILINEPFFPVN